MAQVAAAAVVADDFGALGLEDVEKYGVDAVVDVEAAGPARIEVAGCKHVLQSPAQVARLRPEQSEGDDLALLARALPEVEWRRAVAIGDRIVFLVEGHGPEQLGLDEVAEIGVRRGERVEGAGVGQALAEKALEPGNGLGMVAGPVVGAAQAEQEHGVARKQLGAAFEHRHRLVEAVELEIIKARLDEMVGVGSG